jgi:hypothetical protein
MQITAENHSSTVGPKQREKHHSYNENVDEPAKLIDDEAVEVEREVPLDGNEPVERVEEDDTSKPPAFEE